MILNEHARVRDVAATVHIARQSIVDGDGALYGYELLFRDAADAATAASRDDLATASTVLAAFSEFDTHELLGGRYGFINITRSFLRGVIPLPVEPEDVVLEIPGYALDDETTPMWVSRLVQKGYRVALDDFRWSDGSQNLLDLVDFVKLDVLGSSWDEVATTAERCRSLHGLLVAERVETREMADRCASLGFNLFQGYYFTHPETLSMNTLTVSRSLALETAARLGDPETTMAELEGAIAGDAALYYRLFRIANWVASPGTAPLRSLQDVLERIGRRRLQAWLTLFALTSEDEPNAELALALVRGAACERVARRHGVTPDRAFVTGLLDGVADALRVTGNELVARLPHLTTEIRDALDGKSGSLHDVLSIVHAYEAADFTRIHVREPDVAYMAEDYLHALSWTTQITETITAHAE
jgi:c-di-GMP-related signal transduction protein